jgi:Reverse transcriptase (RNA-dependent DNA polymerase)
MSGLQRYLERLAGHCSIKVGAETRIISTYADDIKLMCTSQANLNIAVRTVKTFLSYIGLEVEISKSKIVVIGAPQVDSV